MTRYQVYRYEIENPAPVTTADENSGPKCSTVAPTTSVINDRRVAIVAIINCVEHAAILNGNAENVPTEAFAKIFITEPVGLTEWPGTPAIGNNDIFLEMIAKVGANGPDGVLHEFPVLYR
jgi:hypothetical protein